MTLYASFLRAMSLDENEAQALLEEYTGPRYQIERHTTVINLIILLILTSHITCK